MLAFDTATPAITVALHDGGTALAESSTVDARRTGELLAPGIAAVLAQAGRTVAEVTAVAVGVGPGPFTGLRVGLVTARTFGGALGIPVHGLCTLAALVLLKRERDPSSLLVPEPMYLRCPDAVEPGTCKRVSTG